MSILSYVYALISFKSDVVQLWPFIFVRIETTSTLDINFLYNDVGGKFTGRRAVITWEYSLSCANNIEGHG